MSSTTGIIRAEQPFRHEPEHIQKCNVWKRKEFVYMAEKDEETLKTEIDEIMSTVDAIMEKVARVIPEDKPETDGQR
jgi:hypothetical protein